MERVPAKHIVSGRFENGWFGANYNMNIYRGCCHGCIYCDSRSECYQIKDFDIVKAKDNALEIIERDLRSKRRKGTLITGAMSDAYNPFEREEKLTRGALKLADVNGFGIVIDTKSDLVLRDIDILLRIKQHSPVVVNFTITTADDELCRNVERGVCPSSARFKAIKELRSCGIDSGIMFMPTLPFINDTMENVENIVEGAMQSEAKWIFAFGGLGVTLRQNQRDHYYMWLDRLFPGLKEQYIQTFGNSYECSSPRRGELWKCFKELCNKYNLPYHMKDIVPRISRPEECVQMSLFDL